MAFLLMLLGLLVALVGVIWLIFVAFQESIPWGLGCLLIPGVVPIVFVIMHWPAPKKALIWYLSGLGMLLVGNLLA